MICLSKVSTLTVVMPHQARRPSRAEVETTSIYTAELYLKSYLVSEHVALRLVGRRADDEGHRSQGKGVLVRAGGHGPQHALQRHTPPRAHHLSALLPQLWTRTKEKNVDGVGGSRV